MRVRVPDRKARGGEEGSHYHPWLLGRLTAWRRCEHAKDPEPPIAGHAASVADLGCKIPNSTQISRSLRQRWRPSTTTVDQHAQAPPEPAGFGAGTAHMGRTQ